MTCKDCIHRDVCYKRESVPDENYAEKCGDFISDKVLEERPQGDLISREALKQAIENYLAKRQDVIIWETDMFDMLDNAPTVDTFTFEDMKKGINVGYKAGRLTEKWERPQGEYVDISKLRLMTVEECAGHTIDYAMGWKACVEWIKNGGADMRGGSTDDQ